MDFVYAMTWAEFQIRLFAYQRVDFYEWQKLREVMWTIYTAPHQDPKKMVKSKQAFLPLGKESKNRGGVSDEMKKIFLGEYQKYVDKVKNTK